ncbi:MAG: hypothetical protein MJ132_04015 [Clostridia bacterium]|nr:hypothetical protein [Clostridia bacterium]
MNVSPIRAFFRAVTITLIICCCLLGGIWGCIKAYENTVKLGFGEKRRAVEWRDDGFHIFDFRF